MIEVVIVLELLNLFLSCNSEMIYISRESIYRTSVYMGKDVSNKIKDMLHKHVRVFGVRYNIT